MRAKHEWRTCGCGQQIGLRESCSRCAAAERARLHAAGVAKDERKSWQAYDNGAQVGRWHIESDRKLEAAQDEARTQREMAGLLSEPGRLVTGTARRHGKAEIMRQELKKAVADGRIIMTYTPHPRTRAGTSPLSQACAAAEEARRLTGVVPYAVATPRPECPMLCWPENEQDDWNTFRSHWLLSSNVFGGGGFVHIVEQGQPGWWPWRWRVVDGVIVFDEAEQMVREHGRRPQHAPDGVTTAYRARELKQRFGEACTHPKLRATQTNGTCPDCNGSVAWQFGSAFTINKAPRKEQHEPPPVGAEVEYAVALADMQRRPEARYERRIMSARDDYRVADGRMEWHHRSTGEWKLTTLDEVARSSGYWTRLPDATTVPEIGAEVSWDVAKADMQARSKARYRSALGCVEHAWIERHLMCRHDGMWVSAPFNDDETLLRYRWVRLA